MPFRHLLLALLVVVIWGLNFIFIKISLQEVSPLVLCAIRFILASIPAIFFIKKPAAPFRIIMLYGCVTFALQFSLLFMGMHAGMTPGMASLLTQVQIFFSMFFAAIFLGEVPYLRQLIGALISFSGIGLVALHIDREISLEGFLFILAAAASWGMGNLITKKINHVNMIALVVWGSFVASFPMLLLAFFFEGVHGFKTSYQHLTWSGIGSLFYIVYASTWIGYGVWNWLLSRYPVSMIVPFNLLVPVVGILSSTILLAEPFFLWKLLAGLLVIAGLCINLLGDKLFPTKIQPEIG